MTLSLAGASPAADRTRGPPKRETHSPAHGVRRVQPAKATSEDARRTHSSQRLAQICVRSKYEVQYQDGTRAKASGLVFWRKTSEQHIRKILHTLNAFLKTLIKIQIKKMGDSPVNAMLVGGAGLQYGKHGAWVGILDNRPHFGFRPACWALPVIYFQFY
jgi:hypothetical protein